MLHCIVNSAIISLFNKPINCDGEMNRRWTVVHDCKWWILPHEIKGDRVLLGKGGFGSVYKRKWKNTDVAVKSIRGHADVGSVQEFQNEAGIMSGLRHRNLCA